jgi:hypothetical protein
MRRAVFSSGINSSRTDNEISILLAWTLAVSEVRLVWKPCRVREAPSQPSLTRSFFIFFNSSWVKSDPKWVVRILT